MVTVFCGNSGYTATIPVREFRIASLDKQGVYEVRVIQAAALYIAIPSLSTFL